MLAAIFFTILQLAWSVWWAALHAKIRRNRAYSKGRKVVASDRPYRLVSPLMYLMQNALSVASFWSNAAWLLKFHHSNMMRALGFLLLFVGSALYAWALTHLGENYSPCYDSHLPTTLVSTGPYRWVRHPMYLAKLAIGVATVVTSESLWFIPPTIYLFDRTIRAMGREDRLYF